MSPTSFDLIRLRRQIRPFRLHWFPRLRSTNDHAAVLRRRGELFAPAVVLTSRQIAGRGRGGNTWYSGPGSITVTFAFPAETHLRTHQLPLVAGLAVRDAAEALIRSAGVLHPPVMQLKWPNDVLCGGRKVAGLLCERLDRVDLVGVGLNVNLRRIPRGLRERIAALADWAGPIDLTDALLAVAHGLRQRIMRRGDRLFAEFLQEYDRHHALVGRTITVAAEPGPALTGRCEGLDDQGRLLLRTRDQLHRIISGHVAARE